MFADNFLSMKKTVIIFPVLFFAFATVGISAELNPLFQDNAVLQCGARLALAARALAYGEKIEYSGPVFDSVKIDGPNVVLPFTPSRRRTGGGRRRTQRFHHCRRGQSVSSGAGKNRRQDGRGECRRSAAARRRALRLGERAGGESVQPRGLARVTVPHRCGLSEALFQTTVPGFCGKRPPFSYDRHLIVGGRNVDWDKFQGMIGVTLIFKKQRFNPIISGFFNCLRLGSNHSVVLHH
jgi:hypothetical protein